ncbi:D-alanyl-D-alanine carboxypeptidase [Streptomyces rhizoryzae]|uniref:D-alanyl-D-alanine carboxypeptidase n=1 Tax=Streptomyces rhizoryzae TaxID=2932493 RepID=UPI0027E47ABF|nr:D-alanyl-D-alanine carboxypeptidase [Streptomyces rhizoryzae]
MAAEGEAKAKGAGGRLPAGAPSEAEPERSGKDERSGKGESSGKAAPEGESAASGRPAGGKGGAESEKGAEPEKAAAAEDGGEPQGAAEPKRGDESKGASGKGDSGKGDSDEGASDEGASDAGGSGEGGGEAVDRATAVFRTTGAAKAGAQKGKDGQGAEQDGTGAGDGDAPADDATRVFAVAKPAASETSGKGAAERPADQPTTVFKLGKDVGKGVGKDVGKGAKDSAKDAKGGDAKGGAAERDAERTSQFVALKSADDGSAERSIGKTAPKTPLRAPGSTADEEKGKDQEKGAGKDKDKKDQGGEQGKGGSEGAGKGVDGKEKGAAAGSVAAKAPEKAPGKAPATTPGAMPPAAPPKPAREPVAGAGAAAGAPAPSAAEAESERTRQEPLPPLDLLAKLTNTPPPPETPIRSVVRRVKIWTPLVVLLVIIFAVVQAVRPLPAPVLSLGDAKSSFTFGGQLSIPWPAQGQAAVKVVGSGDVGTFGEQKPVPTASVAKIMTAYVILKGHPLKKDEKGPQIEVDAKAAAESKSESESRIKGLTAGQKFSEQDMLKMLMIPSGNNIARLLARWDTSSANEAAFVKKMNDAAKDLGMTNTTYTDPSGLDPKTVSTAVDQLKLAEAVMKFDAFRPIVAMPNAEIPGLPEKIYNNNGDLLLAGLSIKGIKTGSSTPAGGTLSWAAYKTVDGKDRLILGTMMDQHFKGLDPDASNSLTMVKDNSKKVIQAVRDALTSAKAVTKGQVVGYVDDGLGGLTPLVATKDLSAVGVPGQRLQLSLGDEGKGVPHEAKAGTVVGELTVGSGASQQKVPVALQTDLAKPTFGAKLTRLG